jgi:hypothetical protein
VKPNRQSFGCVVKDGICRAGESQQIGLQGFCRDESVDVKDGSRACRALIVLGRSVSRSPYQETSAPVVVLLSYLLRASEVGVLS